MSKVVKQVRPVTGENLQDYTDALNEAYSELSRFQVTETEKVSTFEAIIHYEIPNEVIERGPVCGPDPDYTISFDDGGPCDQAITIRLMLGREDGRFCCECMNYKWGCGCPYADGHVPFKHKACPMFNVRIERGCCHGCSRGGYVSACGDDSDCGR